MTPDVNPTGAHRVLTLDGGGLRGLISLRILARVESLLRERYGRPELVLSDYFDLIAGTSTGAVIATMLSLGWSVERAQAQYVDFSERVFRPKRYYGFGPIGRALASKFDTAPLEAIFDRELGDQALDSPALRTLLLVVIKRADTGSVWPLTNIPTAGYFQDELRPDGRLRRGNRHLKLKDVLRASTAAPTYFKYKLFKDIGYGNEAAFVDGAISMHNNPALLALMATRMGGYGLNWATGQEKLLLCSVGTGTVPAQQTMSRIASGSNLMWAETVIGQMIGDASELVQTLMQWLSSSPTAKVIDSMIGTVPQMLGDRALLHYLRYDDVLEAPNLQRLGLSYHPDVLRQLRSIDSIRSIPQLVEVGECIARQVEPAHFPPGLDRPGPWQNQATNHP